MPDPVEVPTPGQPTIADCPTLPPCTHCGGTRRWLNAGLVEMAPWRWHCVACAPWPGKEPA